MQVVYLGGDPSRQGCSVGRLKGGGCFIERLHEVGVAAPSTEKAYRILLLEGCPRIVPVCGLCCLSRLQEKPHNGRAERCCSTAEKGCGLCTCTDPPQPGQNQGVKGPGPGSRASVKMSEHQSDMCWFLLRPKTRSQWYHVLSLRFWVAFLPWKTSVFPSVKWS